MKADTRRLGSPISRSARSGVHFRHQQLRVGFRLRKVALRLSLTRATKADLEIGDPRRRDRPFAYYDRGCRLAKRILRRHGYPPEKQEAAADLVLQKAEVLSEAWAEKAFT